jgi:PmbA protein
MEFSEKLAELLTAYQKNDPELSDWRFDLYEARGLEVGMKNNRIGGPYSAPSYKRSVSGELYLIWKDQRFSSAKLDSQAIENFGDYIPLWKAAAYHDPDGVGLYHPERLPEIELFDPAVEQIVDREVNTPFQLLETGLKSLAAAGFDKIDGKARCFVSQRSLVNSGGLRVSYSQSPVDFYFEVNNSYGESYQEKHWPEEVRINRVIDNTARVGNLLGKPAPARPGGTMRLIFPPDVFEAFLSQFLLANLFGSLVMNRQSRFSLSDFRERRPVMNPDLSLEVNTLLPWRAFSYICTSEGVPGGRIELITDGRLNTPLLSLKYAKKAGMPPTPVAAGGRGFFIRSRTPLSDWDTLIRESERALIVHSVLGLHTQDSSSGSFSLTADQCLLVENGVVLGKAKAVINGDFLGSLSQESSRLGRVEGEDNPGYAFLASAAF